MKGSTPVTPYCSYEPGGKASSSELALFGGVPRFQHALHVGRPNIPDQQRFHDRIQQMLDRKWFSNRGPFVEQLEERVAQHLGARHCILTCNGTVALEIVARALGLHGEVIVPSFTFIATAHALQWQQITPVFCDIDPLTHTLDPQCVEALISPRTTGIIGVHIWGQPCAVETLEEIGRRRGLEIYYDASHAFGCSHQGQMIGNFGRAEVFSLHATKVFHTFEGGAILTNDDSLAAKIRMMKDFGFSEHDRVVYVGTNGKMNEASAAMGLTCLENLDEFIVANYRNYCAYRKALSGIKGIRLYQHKETEKRNYQYIVLEIEAEEAGVTRDVLLRLLQQENVLARRYFYPGCHRMEPYRSHPFRVPLPETEALAERVLVLPTGTAIGAGEIEGICDLIRFAVEHGSEIKHLLAGC